VEVDSIIDDTGEHPRGEDIPPITTSPGCTISAQGALVPTPDEGATNPPLPVPVFLKGILGEPYWCWLR